MQVPPRYVALCGRHEPLLAIICQVTQPETGLGTVRRSVDQVAIIRAKDWSEANVGKSGSRLEPNRVVATVQPDELPKRIHFRPVSEGPAHCRKNEPRVATESCAQIVTL